MGAHYILQPSDVGKKLITAFGRSWCVTDFLGTIFETDVGKRVYRTGSDVISVENSEQRAIRAGRQLDALRIEPPFGVGPTYQTLSAALAQIVDWPGPVPAELRELARRALGRT